MSSASIVLAIPCGLLRPGDSASWHCEVKDGDPAARRSAKTQAESVCHLL